MVRNELVVVLSGRLEAQKHDKRLLKPVAELQQIVGLELRAHLPMRIFEPKMLELEPPTLLEGHDVESKEACRAPVEKGVSLLGEAFTLTFVLDPPPGGKGLKHVERGGLANATKDDDVEADEKKVFVALLVAHCVASKSCTGLLQKNLCHWDAMRQKDEGLEWIGDVRCKQTPIEPEDYDDAGKLGRRSCEVNLSYFWSQNDDSNLSKLTWHCHPPEGNDIIEEPTARAVVLVCVDLALFLVGSLLFAI